MASEPADTSRTFLDPVILSKISSLEILARTVVDGFITGLHKSPYQGWNVEFSEHRPYYQGDDIRYIDWKIWGKKDRYYIKKYEEETNLKGYIFLDSSRSMEFKSGGTVTKFDYARYLTASLAYLMLMQRDSVGLSLFGDGVRQFVPPRAARNHLQVVIDTIRETKTQGLTRIGEALYDLSSRIARRGLVIVISDLLSDPEKTLQSLKNLKHRRNEVIVFQILDPHEADLPWKGYLRLVDLEDGNVLATDPGWLAREYRERVEEFLNRFRRGCMEDGIDYVLLRTDQPLDEGLSAYLGARMRSRARA